jgi:hypothetical protein
LKRDALWMNRSRANWWVITCITEHRSLVQSYLVEWYLRTLQALVHFCMSHLRKWYERYGVMYFFISWWQNCCTGAGRFTCIPTVAEYEPRPIADSIAVNHRRTGEVLLLQTQICHKYR